MALESDPRLAYALVYCITSKVEIPCSTFNTGISFLMSSFQIWSRFI